MRDAIYIRMPRCGSTSIVDFCRSEKIRFFGGKDLGFWPEPAHNTSEHLHQCVSNYIGGLAYKNSFIFSSVRNPYSRAVSMYKHWSWNPAKTFKDFCNSIKKEEYPSKSAKWHSSTLTEHIVDDGYLKVDFVIKLENLQQDFNIICDKIGIPHQQLPHKNKTKHKHYTEYYDDETRQIVGEIYSRDIEYFGYKFGD